MKRTYKRQRRRMFWLIFAFVFITCFAAIGAYTVITYNNTKEDLVYSTDAEKTSLRDSADEYCDLGMLSYVANYFVNANVPAPTSSDFGFVELRDSSDGSTIAQTGNVFTCEFCGKEEKTVYKDLGESEESEDDTAASTVYADIYIDYDAFRASMTDEQYDKICEYLQSTPDDKDMYYELVCTRFYKSEDSLEVKPETVEIVKTCEEFTWYAQDDPVESFELDPQITLHEKPYKITDMRRNNIDTDFVLGKWAYDYTDVKKEARKILQTNASDCVDGYCVEQTGPFTYIYVSRETLKGYSISFTEETDDNSYSYNAAEANAALIYARQFNVLDACMENIIRVSLVILAFFIVMGVVLEFAVIHTFNSRVRQERKRVEMTNAFAHNMKTPIQVITGFAENMERKIQTDEARRYTEVIKRQAFSMDKLVHRMLDYTHLDSDSVKPNKTEFALRDLIDEIVSAAEFDEREFTVETEPTVTINADRELLRLALENLIENAVKYSPVGSVIKISGRQGRLEISNVCGDVSKADLKKLWQPYFRLNRNGEKGSGIGLSIVSSVMMLHKFGFGAETENGVITFYFEF